MKQSKIFHVEAYDGYLLDVKIDYPKNSKSIVVFCQGSGANTYDNRREIDGKQFNYFDLFADEFCKRNIAFCRWSTRGCSLSDVPPEFVSINQNEFNMASIIKRKKNYSIVYNINPIIGDMKVQDITPRVVDKYVQTLQKPRR